jgi:DNA-binding GntR family transcriptional regulator
MAVDASAADRAADEPFAEAPVRPDSLTDIVFDRIRDAIINKSLPPGSAVSEADLAQRLLVSKTPVRESLIRLKEIGLLVASGRRLQVITPSRQLIEDAYEFRMLIEPDCARLAARRAPDADKKEIAASADKAVVSARADDVQGYYRAGRDLHLRIADATGNALLSSAVDRSHSLTLALMRRDLSEAVDLQNRSKHHVVIADAITRGDEDRADSEMREHIAGMLSSALRRFAEQ